MSEDKKTIGFVDDTEDIRMVGEIILTAKGYEVVLGETGKDAINLVNQYNLSALVLDNEMPVMTGLEALKEIRGTNKDLPILILSGSDVKTQAMEYGASAYMAKPFGNANLTAKVDELTQ